MKNLTLEEDYDIDNNVFRKRIYNIKKTHDELASSKVIYSLIQYFYVQDGITDTEKIIRNINNWLVQNSNLKFDDDLYIPSPKINISVSNMVEYMINVINNNKKGKCDELLKILKENKKEAARSGYPEYSYISIAEQKLVSPHTSTIVDSLLEKLITDEAKAEAVEMFKYSNKKSTTKGEK